MKKYVPILRSVSFLLIVAGIIGVLTPVFQRKTLTGSWNYTAKIGGFLNEEENSLDVVAFGSSHMFCSLDPVALEARYGISSYVVATHNLPIQTTYFFMKEALKTQKPDVFLLEMYMMHYDGSELDDSIIADATEPWPLSWNKLAMTANMLHGKKDIVPYFLTLLRYSDRWKELGEEDFAFDRSALRDEYRGYCYLDTVTPVQMLPLDPQVQPARIYEGNLQYLDKIISLCQDNGIQLVLMYAPFVMEQTDQQICQAVSELAGEKGLPLIDGRDFLGSLDPQQDFYDKGHLNTYGCTKLTCHIGDYLLTQGFLNGMEGGDQT